MADLELTTNVGLGGFTQMTPGQRVDALAWHMVARPVRVSRGNQGSQLSQAEMKAGARARLAQLRREAGNGQDD